MSRSTPGVPPKAHSDIVRKARDLLAAHRATRDILLDRTRAPEPVLVAKKRGLMGLFRKKTDPFTVSPAQFDAWVAEIEAYHPARQDMWRESAEVVIGDPVWLNLPDVAAAAVKADKP